MHCMYESFGRQELPDYPVECFRMEDTSPGVFASSHWHRYSEVIYVNSGGYEVLVNGDWYRLSPGELLYIVPGQIHMTICPKIPRAELTVLKFAPELLLSVAADAVERPVLRPFGEESHRPAWQFSALACEHAAIEGLLEELLLEIGTQPVGYLLAVRDAVSRLVLGLLRCLDGDSGSGIAAGAMVSEEFYGILQYIEEHCCEPIQVSQLLGLCHLSYSSFARKLKRLTGQSFTAYLNGIRVLRAQRMLRAGSLPIAEIAAACGFVDPCYFDRVFRRYARVSPSVYRNRAGAAAVCQGSDNSYR